MIKILTAIFCVIAVSAFAQDKDVKIEPEGPYLNRVFSENGVVLSFQKDKKSGVISYYNADLDLVWKKEFDSKYNSGGGFFASEIPTSYNMSQDYSLITPSGSYVYNVEYKPDDFHQKAHYVTQISKAGEMKSFKIDGRDELGYYLQTAFCDDDYFYLLASDNGNEQREKKKSTEKLILNRFDTKTFAYSRIELKLPVVEAGNHTSFWTFAGQNKTEKILVSKNINYEAEAITLDCVAIDKDGKVTRTWKLQPKLNLSFLRPARNIMATGRPFHQVANLDYYMVKTKSGATGMTYDEPRLDYSNFCSFSYDEVNDALYVYGLSGPKPFKKVGSNYDTFYIFKYDSKGTLVWQLQQKAPATLLNYSPFKVHALPEQRNIALRFGADNTLNFSIQVRKLLATFVLSNDGKVIRSVFDSDYVDPIFNVYLTATASKMEPYVKKQEAKKKLMRPELYSFSLSDRDILFQLGDPTELLMFKK